MDKNLRLQLTDGIFRLNRCIYSGDPKSENYVPGLFQETKLIDECALFLRWQSLLKQVETAK